MNSFPMLNYFPCATHVNKPIVKHTKCFLFLSRKQNKCFLLRTDQLYCVQRTHFFAKKAQVWFVRKIYRYYEGMAIHLVTLHRLRRKGSVIWEGDFLCNLRFYVVHRFCFFEKAFPITSKFLEINGFENEYSSVPQLVLILRGNFYGKTTSWHTFCI